MDETHTIAEALPTADDEDQAASQFRGRAARPTAIKLVEDMVPRELFITHIMGGGYLDQVPSDYPSLAVVNRSFNDTMCQPMAIMFRGAAAWMNSARGKKVARDRRRASPCREASICLSMLTCDNAESDLEGESPSLSHGRSRGSLLV